MKRNNRLQTLKKEIFKLAHEYLAEVELEGKTKEDIAEEAGYLGVRIGEDIHAIKMQYRPVEKMPKFERGVPRPFTISSSLTGMGKDKREARAFANEVKEYLEDRIGKCKLDIIPETINVDIEEELEVY